MDNKLYIISHRDYEDNFDEFATQKEELLMQKIKQYKQECKEKFISIHVFEIDKGLIYRKGYGYDDNARDIYDDCVNMKDEYWNC